MKEGKRIANIILSVITITLVAKAFGFLRDAILGSKIGATYDSDAYLMALNSTTIIFLSIGSAISNSAIPLIVKKLKDSDEKARDFVNKLITSVLLISSLLTIIGVVFSPLFLSVVAKGFQDEKMELAILLTRILFPSMVFIALAYIFVAYMQSIGKFIVPSIISFPYNLVIIFYLIFLLDKYGIIGLSLVTLLGWSLQLFIQLPFAVKTGFSFKFDLNFKDEDLKLFYKSILPIIFVASLHQINILIDNMFASTLGHGKVSAIYYGNIIYQALVTTTITGISSVMFPKFNQNLTPENMDKFRYLVRSVLSTVVYLLLPLGIGLMVIDETLISLVFERGQFTYETTIDTSSILSYYSIGMVGYGVIDILNKAFYSLNNLIIPVAVSIGVIALNYILNKVLIIVLGFKGIALATSLSLILGGIVLIYVYNKIVKDKHISIFVSSCFKSIVTSVIMGIVLASLSRFTTGMLDSFVGKSVYIILFVALGIILYGVMSIFMKDKNSLFIYENYIKNIFKTRI